MRESNGVESSFDNVVMRKFEGSGEASLELFSNTKAFSQYADSSVLTEYLGTFEDNIQVTGQRYFSH